MTKGVAISWRPLLFRQFYARAELASLSADTNTYRAESLSTSAIPSASKISEMATKHWAECLILALKGPARSAKPQNFRFITACQIFKQSQFWQKAF
jgi:hypothetical protein